MMSRNDGVQLRTIAVIRHVSRGRPRTVTCLVAVATTAATLAGVASCGSNREYRTFATPEQAVMALTAAASASRLDELHRIFGPEGKELIDSSDPARAQRNREVFVAAAAERWRIVDHGASVKVLVVGNEEWPFPVPLTNVENQWRFDTAAGREEVVARRVGRNELSAIAACRTYVFAQRLYARQSHDGKPAGLYAAKFRSDSGTQNGLYWPHVRGQRRSPLGELLAEAADVGRSQDSGDRRPAPFHGYYFKILTAQGAAADGGAKSYLINGEMSGGHAVVAWPAQYDVTGVMTFLVGRDGVVREKDLGAGSDGVARGMSAYDPDASWAVVQ